MKEKGAGPLSAVARYLSFRDWRLFPKMMVASLLVVVLSLAISGFDSITSSRQALLEQGSLNLRSISNHTASALDEYLLANRNDIAALSMLPETIAFASNTTDSAARNNAVRTLSRLAVQFEYESIAIANLEGTIVLSTFEQDMNVKIQSAPYFAEARKGTAAYISDPSFDVTTNKPAIHFSAPVLDATGRVLAVIRSRASASKIAGIVNKDLDVAGAGTFGILLDAKGIRIAYGASAQDREQIERRLLFTAVAPLSPATNAQLVAEKRFGETKTDGVTVIELPEVAAAMQDAQSKTFESSGDTGTMRHYAAISSLAVKPWRYVLMAPLPVFTKPADELAFHYLIILVLVAIATAIGAYFFARAITRPIVQLTQVADRISLGELAANITIERKDEIGELALALGRLQLGMQAAIDRLRARRSNQ